MLLCLIRNSRTSAARPDKRAAVLKVAAHAIATVAVHNAAAAGVDSIEHAYFARDANLRLMKEKGIYLVPTDSEQPTAFYTDRLRRAAQMGVKIAFGSDARGSALLGEVKCIAIGDDSGAIRDPFNPSEGLRADRSLWHGEPAGTERRATRR